MDTKITRRATMAAGALGVLAPEWASAGQLPIDRLSRRSVRMWNGWAVSETGGSPRPATFMYIVGGRSIYVPYMNVGVTRWIEINLPEVPIADDIDHILGWLLPAGQSDPTECSYFSINKNVYFVLNFDGGGNGWVHFRFVKLDQ